MSERAKLLSAGLALLLGIGCGGGGGTATEADARAASLGKAAGAFNQDRAFEDVRAQTEIGPREAGSAGGAREVQLIKSRLRAAGLRGTKVQRKWRNVVVTIPGKQPGTIVIGAHHDTKDAIPGFVGANDGGSGVGVLLEMARVLPRRMPGPSATLVFFDAEEARGSLSFATDGIRGSRQFIRYARRANRRQGSPPLKSIKAMYLMDLVGDCDLQVPREASSSRRLYKRLKGPAFVGVAPGVLDDHVPFLRAGIPAVDIIDFTFGPGPGPGAYWHTPQDTLDKVCPASLGQVGRAVIKAVGSA